jgi:PAS domain S-box-containing protein
MNTQNQHKTVFLRTKYCFLITITFLIAASQPAKGQQYFLKSYTTENGFPTRIITDACQDTDGYMWFSTYSGISKYDGFGFTNYDTINGLPFQQYRKIKCDEKGVIWAIPSFNTGKIVFLQENNWKSIDAASASKALSVYNTSFDVSYTGNKPVLCMGGYNGIDIYENKKWKHYDISHDKSLNIVYSVAEKNGSFYLSTKAGLCILNNGNLNWGLNKNINPDNKSILAVRFENKNAPNERMWVLTNHSIGYYQKDQMTILAENFLLDDIDVAHFPYLVLGKNKDVLFGNNFSKFILQISERKLTSLRIKNGFSSNGASSVFVDREGNIWITDSRGVDKINSISIANYFESDGLPANEVSAIVETNDGRYVLGHSNQISVLDDNKITSFEFPGNQNGLTRVLDMMKDRDGNIWFTANTLGVGKLSIKDKMKWFATIEGNRTTAICQDNSGKIWIGTNQKLFYFKGDKIVEYEHTNQFNSSVRKIFASDKGGIYITTLSGLWFINKDNSIKIIPTEGNQQLNTYSYFKDKKGTEFVGTMSGLFYIKDGIISRFKNVRLQINNPVYFILQDKDNCYWFGTNNGVIHWDGINDPETFNPLNGLAGRETNRSAGLLDSKGRVWVGTDRGLSCITIEKEHTKTPAPAVILLYTEASDGEKYPLNMPCSISHTDNTLAFHFRGISFVNEDLLTYEYKLEGYDKDWREATQSMLGKIKYTNLKAGKYRLCVRAKNYSSTQGPLVYSAEIQIRNPFFFTWWFITLSFAVLIALLWFLNLLFTQKVVNKALISEIAIRKLAEDELKESQQQLSFVLQGSRLGTWDWDLNTKVVQRNQLCSQILGYSSGEMGEDPKLWQNLIHPADIENADKVLQDHLEGKTSLVEVDYRMRTKDKQYKWIHDRYMIVLRDSDGKPMRISGTISDITERKHSEAELQKSEERLRLLMASLPVAIYVAPVSAGIDIEMITGNVKTLTGFTAEEYLSEHHFWQSRLHPDDRERALEAVSQSLATGGITVEYRWKTADGSYRWFHDQNILKTSGSRKEYLGVFVDINDRKQAELEILKKNEQLRLINTEKDKLFSIISHDLRSPVNGLLGLTSLLTDELENLTTEQVREMASSLFHSATKVNDLLNDLLEWSQLQRGLIIFSPIDLNIRKLADDCIFLISDQANAKNIRVVNHIPSEISANADKHMLQLVLRNLLTNALKVTTRSGTVTCTAENENNRFIRISVTDTGIGMNADLCNRLFNLNAKTSRKGTEGEPSSGLGLILCKEYVEKQNGRIWAESTEGKGSTFHFTLPCNFNEPAAN